MGARPAQRLHGYRRMSFHGIPSPDDIERMPAGDRGPRLRALIQHHRDALVVLGLGDQGSGFQNRFIQHTRAIAGITKLAKSLGLEACLK